MGHRRLDAEDFTCHRMLEREGNRVKRETMQRIPAAKQPVVLALSVLDVADKWTRDMLHMSTNLVQSPGFWPELDERIATVRRQSVKHRDSAYARTAFSARDCMIHATFLRRHTAHECDVSFLHVALGEFGIDLASRLGVESKKNNAARTSVEAMQRVDIRTDFIADAHHEHIAIASPAAMHEQTRRFVCSHEHIVAVQDQPRPQTAKRGL